MKGRAGNAAFFKQAGGNDMAGVMGGGDIIIAAPNRKPNANQ